MVNNFTPKKLLLLEAYFGSCETSLMKLFTKIVDCSVNYFREKSTPYPTNIYPTNKIIETLEIGVKYV